MNNSSALPATHCYNSPRRHTRYTWTWRVPGRCPRRRTRAWRQATNAESTEDDESRESGEAVTLPGGSCTSSMSPSSVAEAERAEAEEAEAQAQVEAEAEAEAPEGATAAGPPPPPSPPPLAATSRRGSSKSVSGFRLQRGQERVMYLLVGVGVGFGLWGCG